VYFRSRDKDGGHTIQSPYPKTHAKRKFCGSVFYMYKPGLMPVKVLHHRNREFRGLLPLWPWPWPDDLHIWTLPYPFKTYSQTKNELYK